MAMPLTPETGLFPGTEVEPFIGAPDLERLAGVVLGEFNEFRPLSRAVADGAVSIVFVFETKPFDPLKDEMKPHIIAKVTKASPLWRCVSRHELVIQFRQAFWDVFDVDQRRAVIHHELSHVEVATDDKQRVKLSLAEHDVEDFTRTMRVFGPIIPGRAAFVKAFLDWQRDQTSHADDQDVRPKGEVNVDQLRGDVDRASRPTPIRRSPPAAN